MPRADLRALLGNLDVTETAPATTRVPPAEPEVAAKSPPSRVPIARRSAQESGTRDRQPRATPSTGVHYSDLERKETRLRADQQNALTLQARRLNRAKGPGGQRITDNTLIRVAIDLLLSRAEKLAGRDEAELRHSLGLTCGRE
jgi:hypothetical protein